jgi:hypothetical protein
LGGLTRSLSPHALIHRYSPLVRHRRALPLRKSARSLALRGANGLSGRRRVRMCFHIKKFS